MNQITKYLNTKPILIPAVVCFPVRKNEVLLMHRIKTSDGLGQDLVSGIGGKVGDEDPFKYESPEEALVREVEEEVRITPTNFYEVGKVTFLWVTKPKWNMETRIYIVEKWEGEPQTTDVAIPEWYEIDQLPKKSMWEDNLHWVPKILAGEKINAFFLYGEDKKIIEIDFR